MGEQVQKRFIWILKNYSTLQDECYYSRPFKFAGCDWHIIAFPKVERCENTKHFSLYLGLVDPESLPSGWRREVKFRLTVVNKVWKASTRVLGQSWFDASTPSWGFEEFMPLCKLSSRDEGYLVGDNLIIIAQLHVFPAIVVNKSQGDSSCQVVQKTDKSASQENVDYNVSDKNTCVNTPQEDSNDDDDDDDGTSEEDSNDDASSEEDSDDDDDDDASEESPDDDDDASFVNGFLVFTSQVESVSHIFKRHPDIALDFRPKNQEIRRAYMSELLSLIEMLCQSPEKLSEDDLSNADDTLADLIDVGFKLDWLKTKLNEVSENKMKEKDSVAQIKTTEEELNNMKLRVFVLECVLEKKKAEALAARASLSFNDVVC